MGVFISWSGKNTKSYMVAVVLRRWLEQVVQGCNPWVSTQDIDAGERWGTELFTQLDNHNVGIICVTKENQAEPWLNFEAGALAKQLKGDKPNESRVCPLLIEMTTSDVTGPLKLLQMVPLEKDGMFKVLQMVNQYAIPTSLNPEVLERVFEKWWPDLQSELQQMKVPEQPVQSSRGTPEMLEEILSLVRSIDKATNPITWWGTFAPAISFAEWPKLPGATFSNESRARAESLKVKLIAEVAKSHPQLSKTLESGLPEFADETLILRFAMYRDTGFEFLTKPHNLDVLKKAANALGYSVKLVRGVTSLDL